jgi:hypothetical protein
VPVTCVVIKGEPVERDKKTDSKWVKVSWNGLVGFISNRYIDTKTDVDNPAKIPPC